MEKVTIVSLYPKLIETRKPGLFPGYFRIEAAPVNEFSTLVVQDCFYWVTFPTEEERSPIKQIVPANSVAESIINDFSRGLPGYSVTSNSMPGFFIIPMEMKPEVISVKYKTELEQAKNRQTNWFKRLVMEADDTWTRTKQYRLITSLQRDACKALGLDKEWLVVVQQENKLCDACRTVVHPEAVICPACHFILNADKFAKMKFAKE